MNSSTEYKFLQQQGYDDNPEQAAGERYNSLIFQPVIVGTAMLIAILSQSAEIFLVFSALLWINTLFPGINPFERLYDALIGLPKGRPPIPPAPAPRRFMQGMAASLMLTAGWALLAQQFFLSYIAQSFIAAAFSALLFGKFCVGAYLYHLLTGNHRFANRTCPWN